DRSLLEKFSLAAQSRPSPEDPQNLTSPPAETIQTPAPAAAPPMPQGICFIHNEAEGLYYCPNCNVWRCKEGAHVYNGVSVCPDCDSISFHIRQLVEQAEVMEEIVRPFSWELKQTLIFPFRHYLFSLVLWLLVWATAAIGEVASDFVNAPPLKNVFFGPMVGWIGKILAFALLGFVSTACILMKADGKERLDYTKINDYSV